VNSVYSLTRLSISIVPPWMVLTRDLGDAVEIRIATTAAVSRQRSMTSSFSRFFTTKPTGEGTGLGLSISYDTCVGLNLFGNGFYATAKRQKEGNDPKFKPTMMVISFKTPVMALYTPYADCAGAAVASAASAVPANSKRFIDINLR
jgi:hypothetical protein